MAQNRLRRRARPNGKPLHQVAALPFRRVPSGDLEVLLVSSRETRRFIIPKGWQPKKLSGWKAARREAREEAGIDGKIARKPFGHYLYWKRLTDHFALIRVAIYPLEVEKAINPWPESSERVSRWLSPADAALLVDEPELIALFQGLSGKKLASRMPSA